MLERAIAAWVARGADTAVVPVRLLGPNPVHQLERFMTDLRLCGSIDEPVDQAHTPADDVLWHVCVLAAGHAGDCPWLDNHTWLDMQRDAFVEQMDPVARVARRAAVAAGARVGVLAYIEVT